MRMTLIALLASCIIATAAPAQEQGEPMKDAKTTQTLCLGRFLVDVPKDIVITGSSAEYRWDKVSITQRVSRESFQRFLSEKEKQLKGAKHNEEPSLLKHISRSSDGNSVVLIFWETPESRRIYMTEAYKWQNGVQFLIKGDSSRDRVPIALEMANSSLSELQFRRNDEIPAVPGFCVNYGFFSGEPGTPHFERASIYFQLKSHPDVRVEVYTRTNGEDVGEGLLARIERKEKTLVLPEELKELLKKARKLRHGQHPVGNIQAEEDIEALPTGDTFFTLQFFWETRGKPRDIYAPVIVVEMKTGEGPSGGIVRPSVTDKQAIELFDSIVNSIRIRPAGTPAVQKPGKQSATPPGTSLMSGETCPQSGEWECYHEQVVGERLRFFAEGEVFPEVLLPVPRTPWQKLRGEPASRPFQTHWVLRRLPHNES